MQRILETSAQTDAETTAAFDAQRWTGLAQLELVFATIPIVLGVTLTSSLILAFLLRRVVALPELLGWIAAGVAVTLLRLTQYLRYRRLAREEIDVRAWRRRFGAGVAMSGLFWGYVSIGLFPSGSLPHQVFIAFVLSGVCAGAMSAYAAVPRVYLLLSLPVLLPLAAQFALEGGEIHYSMAVLTLLFLAVIVGAALATGKLIGNVLKIRTENVELTRALRHQATHDSLVDLVNHGEFMRRLRAIAKISAARHEPYALIFIDLDQFKEVNDAAGHAAGDEMLRRVGTALKARVRADDTAARLGGDEFAVLLQRCPREQALRIARDLLDAIAGIELTWGGQTFRVGASIGVSYTDAGEHDATIVLRAADSACYSAKNNGRGRIEIHHADPVYETSGRFHLDALQH